MKKTRYKEYRVVVKRKEGETDEQLEQRVMEKLNKVNLDDLPWQTDAAQGGEKGKK